MMESELNRFENNINLHPMDVESINPVMVSTFETAELTSRFEEVKNVRPILFERKRKIRRVKSSGIF